MKFTTTTTHDIEFHVEYFENMEGGMDHNVYGKPVKELAQAISLLELARISDPKREWIITADVTTTVQGHKEPTK